MSAIIHLENCDRSGFRRFLPPARRFPPPITQGPHFWQSGDVYKRQALNKAVEEKLICRNPSDGCKLPSSKPREMKVLTPEEIQRLLIQAREDGCYELLLLELSTGLRRGEICALKWDDLNLKTGTLKVERQVHRVNGELVVSQPKTKASNRSIIPVSYTHLG